MPAHDPAAPETLEGVVQRITFYNEENGYCVLRLAPTSAISMWGETDTKGFVTVVGVVPDVVRGENLSLNGTWQTHSTYGKQFAAEKVLRKPPASLDAIKLYLASGRFKGIGRIYAERIVETFGAETLAILDHDPQRLTEVPGISERKLPAIIKGWQAQKDIQAVMLFLQENGVSGKLAEKIYMAYGDEAIDRVQEDPYALARDLYGVGFRTADQIAQNMGLEHNHPRRVETGVVYVLEEATNDGHLYLPGEEVIARAVELLGVTTMEVQAAIERAAAAQLVILDVLPPAEPEADPVRAVYLPISYYAELGIARRLMRMITTDGSHIKAKSAAFIKAMIEKVSGDSAVPLTDQQKDAVVTALTNKVSILTGGPGTGKTTTLRALIHTLDALKKQYRLASPTGRAAKRLSEATGQPASTIHRMLGYSPANGWMTNDENPLQADMVIVDECSMIDAVLANALFRALDPRTHLLLVGDVDQLPSVGAGDVLRQLIAAGVVAVTRLDAIFRQAEGSTIISNAHRINAGQIPVVPDAVEDFFHFKISDNAPRAADLVVDIVKYRLPERFNLDPVEDIQIIVPMYRGPAGVSNLNERLQAALNPAGRKAEQSIGGAVFRVGDKVIQTSNNYDKDVFNGDVGRIRAFNKKENIMKVAFDDRFVEYESTEAYELMHAYAITVHRSQGSEYPVVVMPVITQHYMLLQRNLLYTAITRARQMVVIVGSTKALAMAVNNNSVAQRYTALAGRVYEMSKGS